MPIRAVASAAQSGGLTATNIGVIGWFSLAWWRQSTPRRRRLRITTLAVTDQVMQIAALVYLTGETLAAHAGVYSELVNAFLGRLGAF